MAKPILIQKALELTNEVKGDLIASMDNGSELINLTNKIVILAREILPLVGGNESSSKSFNERCVGLSNIFPDSYAQKCVLAYPGLFPYFVELFPNLFRTIEELVDHYLEKAATAKRPAIEFMNLSNCLPVTLDAFKIAICKLENTTHSEIRQSMVIAPFFASCLDKTELVGFVLNRTKVNIPTVKAVTNALIQKENFEVQLIPPLLSLLTNAQDLGDFHSPLQSQLSKADIKLFVKNYLLLLDTFESEKISKEIFIFLIENQYIDALLKNEYNDFGNYLDLLLELVKNDKSISFVEQAIQSFINKYSLKESTLSHDCAVRALQSLSFLHMKGVSQKVCDRLFEKVCAYFNEMEGENPLRIASDLKAILRIFDQLVGSSSYANTLAIEDKEYLLSRILKEPVFMSCIRMIKYMMDVGVAPSCLKKSSLEKYSFSHIFEAACLGEPTEVLANIENYSSPAIRERSCPIMVDANTAKMTAELLSSEGFAKEEKRDKDSKLKYGQSVAEIQGTTSFCKKTVELATNHPAILSPQLLRDQQSVNPSLSLLLRHKRFGHTFNLEGKALLPDGSQVSLEGFNETFVTPMKRASFDAFTVECESMIPKALGDFVKGVLSNATWHDNATDEKIAEIHTQIHNPNNRQPVVVASGWDWHSTQGIIVRDEEDNYYFYYLNRGADHDDRPGIRVLKIKNKEKITPEFLKRFASRLDVKHSEYLNYEKIKEELGGEEIDYIPMKAQRVGNCVRDNLMAAIHALLLIGIHSESVSSETKPGSLFSEEEKEHAKKIYKAFSRYDKEAVLEDFIIDLEGTNETQFSEKEQKNYLDGLSKIGNAFKWWTARQRGEVRKISSDLQIRAMKAICLADWCLDEEVLFNL